MARVVHLIVDGLALVLIGVGLTAVYVGSERKLPVPVVQRAKSAIGFSDPVVTGSIAGRPHVAVAPSIAARTKPTFQAVSQWSPSTRIWVDPPRR
jgi:hypothetical protein